MPNENKNYLLPVSILVAAVLIAGAVIYSTGVKNTKPENQQANINQAVQNQNPTEPQIDDEVILGDPKATVTVFIFSDYQCPYCGKFYKEAEALIRKNYVDTGKVKMVYKDVAFLGPESTAASQAANCAKDQGKFWQYHDALFDAEIKDGQENSGNLNRDLFKKIASGLSMNVNDFLSCFDSQKYAAAVEKDTQEANSLLQNGVSTPTIFINDKMIQGAYPYSTFSQAIDEALGKK
jgi:protein-disulfide isomerase